MATVVFRIKLCRLLTYKGMQPAKNGVIWSEKYSPGPSGSCAAAVKEKKKKTKRGKT